MEKDAPLISFAHGRFPPSFYIRKFDNAEDRCERYSAYKVERNSQNRRNHSAGVSHVPELSQVDTYKSRISRKHHRCNLRISWSPTLPCTQVQLSVGDRDGNGASHQGSLGMRNPRMPLANC